MLHVCLELCFHLCSSMHWFHVVRCYWQDGPQENYPRCELADTQDRTNFVFYALQGLLIASANVKFGRFSRFIAYMECAMIDCSLVNRITSQCTTQFAVAATNDEVS